MNPAAFHNVPIATLLMAVDVKEQEISLNPEAYALPAAFNDPLGPPLSLHEWAVYRLHELLEPLGEGDVALNHIPTVDLLQMIETRQARHEDAQQPELVTPPVPLLPTETEWWD